MSVNMRQGVSTTVSQQLVMTAQQQQSLKLLQCSGVELEAELAKMLHDNPLLEIHETSEVAYDDPYAGADENYLSAQADIPLSNSPSTSGSDSEEYYMPEMAYTISLQEYLLEQLGTCPAREEDKTLATYLIGDLDDNGYLVSSLEELAILVSQELKESVSVEQLQQALRILQGLEPAGIAARSLAECLLLQLEPARLAFSPDPQVLLCARRICQEGLEALAKADIERLQALTQADTELIRQAHHLIKQLNPRPGKEWSTPEADAAIPDILSYQVDGEWVLMLNPQVLPKLRIVPEYERLVKVMDKQTLAQSPELNEQFKQARSFLSQLKQRFATLLVVSQAVMQHQKDFFTQGLAAIRPLTLKDIASELGMHESTISRATVQKYIATPHGIFELKRFFSTALQNAEGEQTSATSAQLKLRQLIEAENPQKPYSDSKLCELLEKEGIVIARRTVAKYREAMGFAGAPQRKAQALLRGD